MDLETQLLLQRTQSRMSELQMMLALLVVRHGYETDFGWRYDLTEGAAMTLRSQLRSDDPTVSVTYEQGMHVIDAT
jgi:hypothetical protein